MATRPEDYLLRSPRIGTRLVGGILRMVHKQRDAEEAEKAKAAEAARQRAAAEASLKQAQAARDESQERLRLANEQAAQDENKRNSNDPNSAELNGLGFNANNDGNGDGGGSAMTELAGLGGVGPDNLPLGKRRSLGGR